MYSFQRNHTQSVKVSFSNISSSFLVISGLVQENIANTFYAFVNDIVHSFKYGKPIVYVNGLKVMFLIDPIQLA